MSAKVAPVTSQPLGNSLAPWLVSRLKVRVPARLEFLSKLNQLIISQKYDLLPELIFEVKDSYGQLLFTSGEELSNCLACVDSNDTVIRNVRGKEVLRLHKPLSCWQMRVEVLTSQGQLAGSVEMDWGVAKPCFAIKDGLGCLVHKIEGPLYTFLMGGSVHFIISDPQGENRVGRIWRKWEGLVENKFTELDVFRIEFEVELDVRMKAVMIAACLLIDDLIFEHPK